MGVLVRDLRPEVLIVNLQAKLDSQHTYVFPLVLTLLKAMSVSVLVKFLPYSLQSLKILVQFLVVKVDLPVLPPPKLQNAANWSAKPSTLLAMFS